MVKTESRLLQRFSVCLALNCFAISPIILANRLYIDDLGRSIEGYFRWQTDGRPLATWLVYLLNLGAPAINVFPLYQIFSAAILAGAALILSELFQEERSTALALGVLPLMAQPYYLENVSYAFDALTMSAAVLAAIAAVAAARLGRAKLHVAASPALLLASLALYQQAGVVFVLFYYGLVLRDISQTGWRRSAKSLFLGLGILILGVSLYFVGIRLIGPLSGYASERTNVFAPGYLIIGMTANVANYWHLLLSDWSASIPGWVALALALAACLSLIVAPTSMPVETSLMERATAALCLLALVGLSLGPMLISTNATLEPRFLVGIGAVLSLFCLMLLSRAQPALTPPLVRAVSYGLVLALAYSMVVVAFAYGRASTAQKEYEAALLTRLGGDMEPALRDGVARQVAFVGQIPRSPLLVNTARNFPVIDRLVPRHLRVDWWWGHMQLRQYGLRLGYARTTEELLSQTRREGTVLHDGPIYELRLTGETLIVTFLDP
jgi:hypothetical protein